MTELTVHAGWVRAVCAFTHDGRTLLATASNDDTMRIWDPTTGTQITSHASLVGSICAFTQDGRTFLATASDDQTVRTWDPMTGAQITQLTGHTGRVRAVCALTHDTCTLLATASDDRTVRIWRLGKETRGLVVPIRDAGLSVAFSDGRLFVGTYVGLLAIRLDLEVLSRLLR